MLEVSLLSISICNYLALVVLTSTHLHSTFYIQKVLAIEHSYDMQVPGIQALCLLDWLFGESEKSSLSPSTH
jgi:hypothetical protein